MARGDRNDMIARLRAGIVARWFGDWGSAPVVGALFTGWAEVHARVYALIQYVRLQTRIKTATDGWLDLIAADYFGTRILRYQGQTDASFRGRIIAELLRERGTRAAVRRVLLDLTGREPIIFEPQRPADTGGYSSGGCGYGVAGGWGSKNYPFQCLVTAYRPIGSGIATVGGWGSSVAGYSTPSSAVEWANPSLIVGAVTDADIYAAVASVIPAATIAWVKILS